MIGRRKILYVSPTLPRHTGNGLAMRAAVVLQALARHADVYLLVIPIYGSPDQRLIPTGIRTACRDIHVVGSVRGQDSASLDPPGGAVTILAGIANAFPGLRVDVVHVFRLSMLPYARLWRARAATPKPSLYLDLDDVESITHQRLAGLARENGDEDRAREFERISREYLSQEAVAFESSERVYVCSEADRELLHDRGRAQIRVLPNTVVVPRASAAPPDGPCRFMFIGTLGYYANEDAVRWLARDVVPRIRTLTKAPFHVDIYGPGATARLRSEVTGPEATLVGEVPEVTEVYDRSMAVVVPIRAAGGTRIKLLEAFAHRRPVVTTSVGAQGIEVTSETHALVADDTDAFAQACVRLMTSDALRHQLASAAYELVSRKYSATAFEAIVARLFDR